MVVDPDHKQTTATQYDPAIADEILAYETVFHRLNMGLKSQSHAAPGKFTKMVDEVEHVTFSGRDWNLATAMVINGEAGFQMMGDWAIYRETQQR